MTDEVLRLSKEDILYMVHMPFMMNVIGCFGDDQRQAMFKLLKENYCLSCGRKDRHCQCDNDE